jgi:hypothetical protein
VDLPKDRRARQNSVRHRSVESGMKLNQVWSK